jgi:3-oxoacyl-(acyl-carrier-protein) synthase
MKITISAAMQCLKEAGIKTPDAIITGTGRGGVTDMEVSVKDMIRLDEGAMNPTAFIQSTYNSPNGWIAMQSGCTCYNQTFVHRGCSFELALFDAQMLMAEANGSKRNVLVGCYDEMTEEYFIIRGKRGYWKKEPINSATLLQHTDSPGTIGGEGAAFFLLSNEQPQRPATRIEALKIVHNATSESLAATVYQMLNEAGIAAEELSLVLTGLNGDSLQSKLYEEALSTLPKSLPIAGFKHLCGEYDTAAGFGLWLINQLLTTGILPNGLLLTTAEPKSMPFSKVLFINHFILGTASVLLASRT